MHRVARPSRQGGRVAQRQEAAPCYFNGTWMAPDFAAPDFAVSASCGLKSTRAAQYFNAGVARNPGNSGGS
jgi:hypothetical protein